MQTYSSLRSSSSIAVDAAARRLPPLLRARPRRSPALHARAMATPAAGGGSLPTGYLYHELYMWHNPGPWGSMKKNIQSTKHYENAETKRRLHNLVAVSGLMEHLKQLKPRPATVAELERRVPAACCGRAGGRACSSASVLRWPPGPSPGACPAAAGKR